MAKTYPRPRRKRQGGPYHHVPLTPDSPALANFPATTRAKLTTAQHRLLRRLEAAGGKVPLRECNNHTVAGLLRRGLVVVDDAPVRMVHVEPPPSQVS